MAAGGGEAIYCVNDKAMQFSSTKAIDDGISILYLLYIDSLSLCYTVHPPSKYIKEEAGQEVVYATLTL